MFFENLSGYISPDIIYEMLCSKFLFFLSFFGGNNTPFGIIIFEE